MLKLRDLDTQIEREITQDGELIGSEWLTKEAYCTEDNRKSVPVTGDYDIFSENINLLNQLTRNLRLRVSPRTVTYNGFNYSINEVTKTSLREISELGEDGLMYEYSTLNGVTEISVQDAVEIRKLMLNGTQLAFRKFKIVTDLIMSLETMDDVEGFNLSQEWVLS